MNRKAAARCRMAAGRFEEMAGQLQFQLDTHIRLHLSPERSVLAWGMQGRRLCSWPPARRPTPDTTLCARPQLCRCSTA